MGFFGRLIKSASFKNRKKKKQKAAHAKEHLQQAKVASPTADEEEELPFATQQDDSEPNATASEDEWGNEIDVDALPPSDRSAVLAAAAEVPRDTNIPSSFDFGGNDDVSLITLETCPSFYRPDATTPQRSSVRLIVNSPDFDVDDYTESVSIHMAYRPPTMPIIVAQTTNNNNRQNVDVDDYDDDDEATAVEVILPEQPQRPSCASVEEPELQSYHVEFQVPQQDERLADIWRSTSPRSFHSNGRRPHNKQRNLLLKYQQSTASKAAEMKQHIKGYFRYVPRGTEDNDISVIST
ncbi:expressed unknown protein [Seminavis robusta]|uniref:Uncharacterized protein n=1 Tax=Seminavis robusta TaxID=568900 RepID=A0A9N8F0J0_9STRA|nr:expressed unknown protein [Seminavis robusta]|eukprot:Sro2156_g316890.1 n/a (295) ;mRNA; r:7059-7943